MVLLAGEFTREWVARDNALRETETNMVNLARSVAQHADDSFEMADVVLHSVVATLERDGTSPHALAHVRQVIATGLASAPRLRALFVYDAGGRWIASSATSVPANANNSDRDYFKHHRESPDKSPLLGRPIVSRSGGQWIVTLTRRFDQLDGSFGGVVLASIDAVYFADFYKRFDIGRDGSIALVSAEGMLLTRHPFDARQTGRNISDTPLYIRSLAVRDSGIHHYVSPIDRVSRIAGFQRSAHFPVTAVAAVSRAEALNAWRSEAWRRAGIGFGVTLVIAVLGLWLADQIGRRQEAEAAVGRSEAEFRLIAEGASDFVSRIGPDGIRRYASPAALRIFGVLPEDLVGRPAVEIAEPEDLPILAEAAARLRAGISIEETVAYRARHRNGAQIWLESSLRIAGDGMAVVSITRDITDRKAVEAQLSEMARTDGLTGLHNRRSFDEALAVECGRTLRTGGELSVVLIDIDRFKQFNDTYGHPKGDACLRTVAALVAGAAKRPGDLAARLGGEELALMLPQTGPAGAAVVAERLRREIEEARIPHTANVPWGVVTASMGIAAAAPSAEDGTPSDLLDAADRALYAAKANGRNRIETVA